MLRAWSKTETGSESKSLWARMLVRSEESTATRHNEQSRLALEPVSPQSERDSRSR